MRKSRFFIPVLIFCMLLGIFSLLSDIEEVLKLSRVKEEYIFTEGYYVSAEYQGTRGISKYRVKSTYRLVYEYSAGGVVYKVKTDYSTTDIPPAGQVRTVWYNPDNPSEAVLVGTDSSSDGIWFGILFTFVPAGMITGIFAANGKLKGLKNNITDIIAGSILIIVGIAAVYVFSGTFSFTGLFEAAGIFSVIPILFMVCGVPVVCRGLLIKKTDDR